LKNSRLTQRFHDLQIGSLRLWTIDYLL